MGMATTYDWSLVIEDHGYCTARQYRTRTEYRGDEAFHRGTEQVSYARFSVQDLPSFILRNGIKEFSRDEDMQLVSTMPHDPA